MNFNSVDYFLFLVVVFGLYWRMTHRGQNIFLLGASYFFYGYVHTWLLLLILGITLINYLGGRLIHRQPQRGRRWLGLAVALNLMVLGVFKYFNFFTANVAALLNSTWLQTQSATIEIFLPIGISFYTFQAMGYTIDVYRGTCTVQRDPIDFALFVSFFPQLVAGPIERAGHLLAQIKTPRTFTADLFSAGLLLIAWGLFKKLVIADNLAPIVDKNFGIKDPNFPLLWTGAIAFSIQILADFWGYTDIARGTARLLGFNLVRNFNAPYLSASPSEFWRRWHQSLSYWFRDYIYIPLGGSQVSTPRWALNIMVTFLLSGLWHGAAWNFVLWGGYHGLLVIGHRCWQHLMPAGVINNRLLVPLKVAATYLLVTFGWMLFRETGGLDWIVAHLQLFPGAAPKADWEIALYFLTLTAFYALPLLGYSLFAALWRLEFPISPAGGRTYLYAGLTSLLFISTLILRSSGSGAFIYFQF